MTHPNPPPSPLQVLLDAMRRRLEADDEDGAVKIATIAAPYMHARRTATPQARPEPDQLSDAELDAALRQAGTGMACAPEDPEQPDGLG